MKRREFVKRTAAGGVGLVLSHRAPDVMTSETRGRVSQDFGSGWRFLRDSVNGCENPGFNDGDWEKLKLPTVKFIRTEEELRTLRWR